MSTQNAYFVNYENKNSVKGEKNFNKRGVVLFIVISRIVDSAVAAVAVAAVADTV